jgi:hypothetical protein
MSDALPEPKRKQVFGSIKACSKATGIPIGVLQTAKLHPDSVHGVNGFHQSGRIYWEKLEPWLEQHKEELETLSEESLAHWKTRKTKADALIAEIELDEAKKKTCSKEEVRALLKKISSAQMAMLKARLTQELPPKLLGLSVTEIGVIMERTVREVCQVFQGEIDKWQ